MTLFVGISLSSFGPPQAFSHLFLCTHHTYHHHHTPAPACLPASCTDASSPCLQRRAYKVKEWADSEDFLTQVARASGKLLKFGDADLKTAGRMVLLDWQRGKIPYFTLPPDYKPEAPEKVAGPGAETSGQDQGGREYGVEVGDQLAAVHCRCCIHCLLVVNPCSEYSLIEALDPRTLRQWLTVCGVDCSGTCQ